MSVVDISANEMVGSLTGFEELAIQKAFGINVNDLGKQGTLALRAAVFSHLRRGGAKDRDAYNQAMELPLREVQEYFADEEPEVDPEEPVTDQGKDS